MSFYVRRFFFEAMCFYLIVMRGLSVEQFFVPAALVLGLIFQCLFTVGSVPDEQTHLDTAYKFSNRMLFVEETENPYTIYKRVCDVEMSDMLTNGLETNSHYLLMTETFTEPEITRACGSAVSGCFQSCSGACVYAGGSRNESGKTAWTFGYAYAPAWKDF